MTTLWQRIRVRREARLLKRRAIPDRTWQLTLDALPFLANRSADNVAEVRRLATLFLTEKEFTGIGGVQVTDEMAVCIAAQACLPILRLGLPAYRGFVGIVVHADEVVARRSTTDDDGIVHEYDEVLTGEAMEGGPVMLSWRDASEAGTTAEWGYNVVIHEFAHVLDMSDGVADGVPFMASAEQRKSWLAVLEPAFDTFCADVDSGHDTLLDPYGATRIDEFFAVAAESFFVSPHDMRAEYPALYALLSRYFEQDPAVRD